jgi:hypothetical protein
VEFFDTAKLQKDILLQTSLRANRAQVYRKSSNGDNFAFFVTTWTQMTPVQQRPWMVNTSTFKELLGQIFGSEGNDLDKWLPVIRRQRIFKELAIFTSMPWGRASFVLGNAHSSISCHFDFVRERELSLPLPPDCSPEG